MKTKSIKEQLTKYFFLHPTVKLRVRQIEREVNMPLPSVIRYTHELNNEGILKSTEIANIIVYSADRASPQFLMKKKMYNLQCLYDSGLINFLKEELNNPLIIVFGSYSRGEDIETSDIDLYIEYSAEKKLNLKQYETALQRKIQTFFYKNIHSLHNKELANNIVNGIVLNGYLGVFT